MSFDMLFTHMSCAYLFFERHRYRGTFRQATSILHKLAILWRCMREKRDERLLAPVSTSVQKRAFEARTRRSEKGSFVVALFNLAEPTAGPTALQVAQAQYNVNVFGEDSAPHHSVFTAHCVQPISGSNEWDGAFRSWEHCGSFSAVVVHSTVFLDRISGYYAVYLKSATLDSKSPMWIVLVRHHEAALC